MTIIHPADAEAVTLSRADDEALLAAAEDAADRATFRAWDAKVAAIGPGAARADTLPVELATLLLDGEHLVRVWRERRGPTGRALAEAAGVTASHLSGIENGRKPGSLSAMLRIARALDVPVEDLARRGDAA